MSADVAATLDHRQAPDETMHAASAVSGSQ